MNRVATSHRPAHGAIATPKPAPGQTTRARTHCLLALDGNALTPKLLSAAEAKCMNGSGRVDILLANAPRAPEALLHKLLITLESMDVEYRLTSTEGDLGELIPHYLRRHKSITQIMVATMPTLGDGWKVKVANLRYQGYRFCTLMGLRDD